MRAPWVKHLVALFVFIAMFTYSVEAVNCSAIKVPHLQKKHFMNYSVIIRWSHTVPNATYTINGCCDLYDREHLTICSKCPTFSPVSNCHDYNHDKKSATWCLYAVTQQGVTHYFNLTVDVPGCRRRYQVSSLNATLLTAQTDPVTNLTLTFQPAGLLGKWLLPPDKYQLMKLCYRYSAYEVLDSGERQKLVEKSIPTLSVIVPMAKGKLHAYTIFEFCVKMRLCERKNIYSDEKCVRKRTPPAAPSKPVKMLCGSERQDMCFTVKNSKQRNVTLIWELPEKSSWNGLATVIKMKIELTSKDENRTFSILVNATETNYTLQNLRRDGQYQIQLQFCSNGGDGPSTPPILLSKDVEIDNTPNLRPSNDKIESKVLVIIIVSSVVVIVAVIVIFTYLILNSKRKQNKSALPHLQPPGHDPVHSGTDPGLRTNPTDYDFLVLNSEETRMHLDLHDKSSSGSTESTNDSASCPLVKQTPDISPKSGYVDVTYYPEKSGSESGSLTSSGDRSSCS